MDEGDPAAHGARVVVHTLPLMVMVEHFTRSQLAEEPHTFGILLGTTSVQQVFPTWDVVGWYTVQQLPTTAESITKELQTCTPEPLAIVLHPSAVAYTHAQKTGTLPISAYLPNNGTLEPTATALGTAPAEHVVLSDANSRARHTGDDSSAENNAIFAAFAAERDAMQALYERIQSACAYVDGVRQGLHPHNDALLRRLAAAVANQGSRAPPRFEALQERDADYAHLVDYLADLTNNLHTLNELVELGSLSAHRGV
ncbi:hypothetical protein MBRA1_001160 [Malassezia brasiliensis]|uniref:EIF3F/CSN6-like C-terminal domain-containing protein n=1 Tax=Malassezia brasiliensis TaxID=1821822 RepID=A0AAF0IP50_9BASI|nr:hypothetical protein MBRA1_001160 [Malassezia brasiliensis]